MSQGLSLGITSLPRSCRCQKVYAAAHSCRRKPLGVLRWKIASRECKRHLRRSPYPVHIPAPSQGTLAPATAHPLGSFVGGHRPAALPRPPPLPGGCAGGLPTFPAAPTTRRICSHAATGSPAEEMAGRQPAPPARQRRASRPQRSPGRGVPGSQLGTSPRPATFHREPPAPCSPPSPPPPCGGRAVPGEAGQPRNAANLRSGGGGTAPPAAGAEEPRGGLRCAAEPRPGPGAAEAGRGRRLPEPRGGRPAPHRALLPPRRAAQSSAEAARSRSVVRGAAPPGHSGKVPKLAMGPCRDPTHTPGSPQPPEAAGRRRAGGGGGALHGAARPRAARRHRGAARQSRVCRRRRLAGSGALLARTSARVPAAGGPLRLARSAGGLGEGGCGRSPARPGLGAAGGARSRGQGASGGAGQGGHGGDKAAPGRSGFLVRFWRVRKAPFGRVPVSLSVWSLLVSCADYRASQTRRCFFYVRRLPRDACGLLRDLKVAALWRIGCMYGTRGAER